VDELVFSVYRDLELSEVGRSLWEPAITHLARVAEGGDETPLLVSIQAVARSAGLSQSVSMAVLLEEFAGGSHAMRDALEARDSAEAREVHRLLAGLENVALTRIATGYSSGLEQTILRLRRDAEDSSPVDPSTGAMKPAEINEQLSLEADRCQRMEMSLGLLELGLEEDGCLEASPRPSEDVRDVLHHVGVCLRENLRRYDSIGLTSDGGFLLVLPDISRRGLAGAAERLRRELSAGVTTSAQPRFLFALAHYDYVDVSAAEMLEALDRSMHKARLVHEPLSWS
jgi:hypothetical protein